MWLRGDALLLFLCGTQRTHTNTHTHTLNTHREIMDAMWVPEGYTSVYGWSFLYVFSLTLPHSTAVQVAWPDQAITNGAACLLAGWLCVCFVLAVSDMTCVCVCHAVTVLLRPPGGWASHGAHSPCVCVSRQRVWHPAAQQRQVYLNLLDAAAPGVWHLLQLCLLRDGAGARTHTHMCVCTVHCVNITAGSCCAWHRPLHTSTPPPPPPPPPARRSLHSACTPPPCTT
jgi:hypothetical protein